ncbi:MULTISPECIES: flagellar basal body P-ring formation chaperone FlgA [unclassified Achromobacter]|uniref:flagellar basal body P-ring formation chaperone FlgA n=1 Tax=unclassified Achromobacter TaxID=2626865 RepID=UPI000B519093|nr:MULTISPECIES: flagellar basal body P-ring formation chaperone FlgA [unclassified Achromobacter]OWT79954.1 flagella basal body P-ring formation protein FlgA [Achromobacter sp. HZ34]OWT81838.1 flagella basal body P-ring formation protein FlgA [Achromobacter sp. HZ28]
MPRFLSLFLLAALTALPLAVSAQEATQPMAPQDPAAVISVADDYLRQQLASISTNPTIKFDEIHTERLQTCDDLSAFMSAGARPRARMSVGVRCAAPRPWSVYVQASVSAPGQYFVAARNINAGEPITPDALVPRDGDLVNLPPGAVTDGQSIIGMTASYRIATGQPIKLASLRSPGAIQRGQSVRVNAHGRGFSVSTEGVAMESAAPGSTVQVRTASGQVVSGIVQRTGSVEVPL